MEFKGTQMRSSIIRLLLAFLLCHVVTQNIFAETTAVQTVNTKTYLLLPEDVLEISVWKEEGLKREVVIRPDGKISFPLVGHIQAAGKTPEQLEKKIVKRLKSYISDPVVNVSILKTAGNKIYVIGKVNRPGVYPVGHYIDVMQALSLAGGLTAYADGDDITIIRRQGNKEFVFLFDYDDVEDGDDLEQNILLKGGDVVIVP